jgi:hypothetical protein
LLGTIQRRCSDLARRVATARAASTSAALLGLGCVSIPEQPDRRELPCAVAMANPNIDDSVVFIQALVGNTSVRRCSGVAIGRSLIVTQLKCVSGRSQPAGFAPAMDAGPPLPPQDRAEISGSSNYDTRCQQDAGWAATETGDFGARLAAPLDSSVLNVSRVPIGPETPGIPAAQVIVTATDSVCGDALAFIILGAQLDVTPLPIRFGMTQDGQTLRMSGFCRGLSGETTRDGVASSVEAVTTYWPTSKAPPRSLLARGSVTGSFSGGAATDPTTSALVGIISSGALLGSCSDRDPEASTVVFLLAPYRRMLLDVADQAGEPLHAELQPEIGIRPCAER